MNDELPCPGSNASDNTTGQRPGSSAARLLLLVISLSVATAIWLPCVHFIFSPNLEEFVLTDAVSPKARAMAQRHLRLWADSNLRQEEINRMRASNAEWDFMGRTFLVLTLVNMGLHEPDEKQHYLTAIDAIVDETLSLERDRGLFFFLMNYAQTGFFIGRPPRSLFIDGEIALMLGARRMLSEKQEYKHLLRQRTDVILDYMERSPVLSAESYPDECWTFCNTTALAAMKIADALDGTDHSAFARRWLDQARHKLIDPQTGLLISSYTYEGSRLDGPEGSSIWWVAHCLQLIDEEFACDQYDRARGELAADFLGFGFAREWPSSCPGAMDVDSGPIIPLLGASAASSGLALVGASAFDDADFLVSLLASLNLAGFPTRKDSVVRYCASNQVGDAVILYAMVQGPLWKLVKERTKP